MAQPQGLAGSLLPRAAAAPRAPGGFADTAASGYTGQRFVALFPAYLDAMRTVAQGRKVPRACAAEFVQHKARSLSRGGPFSALD